VNTTLRLEKQPISGITAPSNATRLPENFGRTFQLHYVSMCSSPSMICRIQAPKQQRSWWQSVSCGQAAHHPAANGLMERFHRTLRATIMCHADQHWAKVLPPVLLGILITFKADLQASVTELLYGEPLRIPGELLTPTSHPVDPAHLITQLRQHMAPSDQFRKHATIVQVPLYTRISSIAHNTHTSQCRAFPVFMFWRALPRATQSQSYLTTDGRSVRMSWSRAHSGACDQILLIVGTLLSEVAVLFCGEPSLTRGRFCSLQCNHSMIRVVQNP
jgi:hypothetical protein